MKFLTKVTKGSIFGFDYSMYYIVLLPPEVFKVLRLVLKEKKTSDNFFWRAKQVSTFVSRFNSFPRSSGDAKSWALMTDLESERQS